jgi:PAS domain S-box-containing protein
VGSSTVVFTARLTLPSQSVSVGEARRFVAAGLTDHGLDEEVVESGVLLTSEVITNAVVHCSSSVRLRLTVSEGEGALVEAFDACTLVPMQRQADEDSVTGRGLAMVELLASAYGTASANSGKVVWFTVGGPDHLALPGQPGWSPQPTDGHGELVQVLLRGVPLGLYDVMRRHNESLLREYQIHLLSQSSPGGVGSDEASDAREDLARVVRARGTVATAVCEVARTAGPAADDPVARFDVPVALTREEVVACADLPAVVDRAEALARDGLFLTRPALPELLSLRNWVFPEVAAQAGGAEPTVWSVGAALVQAPATPPVPVDLDWVRRTDRGVVVADQDNRIRAVSPAAAALLGWEPDQLAGRRLTCIVPPAYREAHVTGFARHVHMGHKHVLGTELRLPALRRDGSEVPVRLRIEQSDAVHQGMYLGWIEQLGPTSTESAPPGS